MSMCFLRPPNSQHFSDEVITGVVERSRSTRDVENSMSPGGKYYQTQVSHTHTTREHEETGVTSMTAPPGHWQTTSVQDNTTFMTFPHQNRKIEDLQCSVSMPPPTYGGDVSQETVLTKPEDQIAAMAELVISEKQRLRELRRMRQIRYRKKKDNYALTIEEETRELREEIEKLAEQRRVASVAVSASESVWGVAAEYFRLFQYGVRGEASTLLANRGTQSSVYDRFLTATMAPNVVFNSESGQEAMLTSWKSLSLWFEDIELELEGLEKNDVDSVIATTIISATITQKTLQCVFPYLRTDETTESESSVNSQLASKLHGQRIVMRGSTHFYWDRESRRVARIMSQSDMLTPMLRLLGDLEDVSDIFEGSLVTLDFQWNT